MLANTEALTQDETLTPGESDQNGVKTIEWINSTKVDDQGNIWVEQTKICEGIGSLQC